MRDRMGMYLERKGGGEELERTESREIVTTRYCMRGEYMFNKRKIKIDTLAFYHKKCIRK